MTELRTAAEEEKGAGARECASALVDAQTSVNAHGSAFMDASAEVPNQIPDSVLASTPIHTPVRARMRGLALLLCIAAAWLAFDLASKAYFNSFQVGEHLGGPFLGLFQFTLVHNTGAAWGMFGDSTVALGVLSVVVCAMLLAFFLFMEPPANLITTVGLGLVVAGGIGNAIDRFSQAYVVDFIDLAFMDFPVFNIADIGVTCGFVIAFLGIICAERQMRKGGEPRR